MVLVKVLLTLGLIYPVSAFCYRFGGTGKPYWTKTRDILVPLAGIDILLLWWKVPKISGFLALAFMFGLAWMALSTYWDDFFGYDNFFAHGFGCGLASFPLVAVGIHWWAILLQAVVCALGMGIWSAIEDNDVREERGRGAVYAASILCLLL